MKIGELASATASSVETVRFYEREGLMPTPPRSLGNYRRYGPEHVDRMRFIRHCRTLDMTHDEIRTLLAFRDSPDQNCREVDQLLDDHIGHVAHRIAELEALQGELTRLRRCCDAARAARDCGIMQSLGREEAPAAQRSATHGSLGRTHG